MRRERVRCNPAGAVFVHTLHSCVSGLILTAFQIARVSFRTICTRWYTAADRLAFPAAKDFRLHPRIPLCGLQHNWPARCGRRHNFCRCGGRAALGRIVTVSPSWLCWSGVPSAAKIPHSGAENHARPLMPETEFWQRGNTKRRKPFSSAFSGRQRSTPRKIFRSVQASEQRRTGKPAENPSRPAKDNRRDRLPPASACRCFHGGAEPSAPAKRTVKNQRPFKRVVSGRLRSSLGIAAAFSEANARRRKRSVQAPGQRRTGKPG